ncbi:MAG: HAMP domain-containing protein [Thermoleophilales bacterium]|nr:HAMP domain-containing protein [Thermoleophilales bacterium]
MRGTIRQRLTISVVAVTAVMLALLVLGFNLSLRSSLDGDVDRLLAARAQATLDNVDLEGGRLDVSEGADDGAEDALVWIYADGKPLEKPQVTSRLDQVAASLATEGVGERDDPDSDTRLFARPIIRDGQAVGTVVTGVSLDPYERTADRAAVASVALALIMLVLITITTLMVVGRALKPVSEMTEEAANWSEHDLDRRFNEGEPTDELTRLAATFDTMLDRMAYMVRHERNFSAELSHELRTPLSAISAEAEITLRKDRSTGDYRESLVRIAERSKELTRILETLLDVARAEGTATSEEATYLVDAVESAVIGARPLARQYGVTIDLARPESELKVRISSDSLRRMISPVLENAITYAASEVAISVGRTGRLAEVLIGDDGPGFSPEDLEIAFEPGTRGSAPRNEAALPGTGLGLALARRLARANGGDVEVRGSGGGGAVRLVVPAATA